MVAKELEQVIRGCGNEFLVFHEQEFVFHIYYAGMTGHGNLVCVLKTYVEELRKPESGPERSWLGHITIHSSTVEKKAILVKAQLR